MVVDFHTHVFQDSVAPRALASLGQNCGISPKTDGTVSGIMNSMKENHIDYSVVLPVATSPRQVKALNNFAAEINNKNGLLSFGTIHQNYSDIPGELQRIKAMGLYGLKLHPDFIGMYFDDPVSVETVKYAMSLGLPVLVHAGWDLVSKKEHHCTPEMISRLLPEFKGGTLIAAHYGGLFNIREAMEYIIGEDVYIDTSFGHQYFGLYELGKLLKKHDPDRILFGTDSPWEDQGLGVKLLYSMGLSDTLIEKILWDNPARLLGLK